MASTINASSTGSGGLISTGDASGTLELQANGTTKLSVASTGVSITGGIASPLEVTGNSTAGAEIRLPEDTDNGSNYVALKAADSIASNVTFTLPAADGTSGQVIQTNGSGTLSFATPAGGFSAMQIFTSSGTFTIPAGKTTVKVTVVGAGGGADGYTNIGGRVAGSAGGNSSIQSGTETITTVTANGGSAPTNIAGGAAGGTASNGDINIKGGGGGAAATDSTWGSSGNGGSSTLGGGARSLSGTNAAGENGGNYGGGGGGAPNLSYGTPPPSTGGGGGGGTAIKYLTSLTPGNTISVTVGSGGAGGTSGAQNGGGAGAGGVVIFEY